MMIRNFISWLVALFLVVVLSLSLFYTRSNPSPSDTIRVGALLSLSGDYAPLGEEIMRGIELAGRLHSEKGNIEVFFEDIGTLNRRLAVTSAQKSLNINRVDIALSAFASESEPLAPIFQANGIPLLTLWDSSEKILSMGENIFSNGFSVERAGEIAAEYLRLQDEISKVAVVSHDDAWSVSMAEAFIKSLESVGGSVIYHQSFPQDATDFRSSLIKIRSLSPDAIYFPLVANPSLFLRQARDLGINAVYISGDTMIIPGELEAAGEAAEGVLFTAIYSNREEELQRLHKEVYGSEADDSLSLDFGYSGMELIYQAAYLSKENGITLKTALTSLLGDKRSAARKPRLYTVRDGNRIALNTIE